MVEGITSDPVKVKAIVDMTAPTNIKGVRSFLGMVNYYSKTIPRVNGTIAKVDMQVHQLCMGGESTACF